VVFNAEFNFETMAYLKLYFINKETLRSFKRDNIDVFDFYDINHINPVAIYTNGPIGIGMGIKKELPIGVYTDKENIPFSLGITIQNDWDGIIKDVTELNVYVHDSIELIRCDHEMENKGHVDEEQANYNVYSLIVPNRRTQNISDYETITCSVNAIDPESLLGGESIITRYFRVSTKYIYELEKSTPIEVAETEYYDLYDFSTRTWCEADPCNIENCYWDEDKMKCVEKEEEEIPIVGEWRSYDDSEVELKIRGAAKEYDVPEKLALGIAETENNGLKHTETVNWKNCVGVMQIEIDKNNWCSSCSMTKEDLYDINNNIECGVRIFKSKYSLFCHDDGSTKMRDSGKSDYQEKVEFWCKNPLYVKKYLEYDKDCIKMAIRGYNGLGCDESDGANVDYVEEVVENMKKFD